MSIRFQIMVLLFIRDWYQLQAVKEMGKMREFFNERAGVYQEALDELVSGASGGDE